MGLLFRLLQMTTPVKQAFQILAVDDESTVLRGIKMLLEHDGHKVHAVDSGEAAMVLFEQRRFDLVITDFSMPGMKGDQLAARIKAIRPDQPIIMATAFADEFKTFGRPSGGVDFLLFKPFSIADLREAIDQVLPGRNPDRDSGMNLDFSQPSAPKPGPSPKP